uniref:Uncharacterized protein n=1 Tax=Manihot esculenta TaxID=3983 RepID=A0A2C9V971_MANES
MIARMGLSTYARLMKGAGPCAVGSIHVRMIVREWVCAAWPMCEFALAGPSGEFGSCTWPKCLKI